MFMVILIQVVNTLSHYMQPSLGSFHCTIQHKPQNYELLVLFWCIKMINKYQNVVKKCYFALQLTSNMQHKASTAMNRYFNVT